MLSHLAQDGFLIQSAPEGADLVVINTCGFIEPARQESLGVIQEMLALKRRGQVRAVVVAGCLAERLQNELARQLPEVDAFVGVFGREEIAQVCQDVLSDEHEQRMLFRPAPVRTFDDRVRLRITPRHYAYLKISEGCDRLCTFCAIPKMRGKHISKPIEQVLDEAAELVADGVRELILVAQDTTYYGIDLYGEPQLARLLRLLDSQVQPEWIRVLYAYPLNFTEELVEVLAHARHVVPYLDIPLQHINDRILRRMKRRTSRRDIEGLIERLRQAIPGLVLRTTFIVGFPGETEAEFAELCEFVRRARLERVGVFSYSLEPDTPAARLDGHLPEELKEQRRQQLMEIQQEVAYAWACQQTGKVVRVLVDGPDPHLPGWVLARSYADAPEIDGVVRIKSRSLQPGDWARVVMVGADGYDLIGRVHSDAPARAGAQRNRL